MLTSDPEMLSPEEEEAIVPKTPAKAIVAALIPIAALVLEQVGVNLDEEVWAAIIVVLEAVLVYVVPNRPQ